MAKVGLDQILVLSKPEEVTVEKPGEIVLYTKDRITDNHYIVNFSSVEKLSDYIDHLFFKGYTGAPEKAVVFSNGRIPEDVLLSLGISSYVHRRIPEKGFSLLLRD